MNNHEVDYELLGKIITCIQEAFEFEENAFKDLSLSTDINRDLGIEGDDANELMPEFFKKFSVDIESYDPCRYFVPEGHDMFSFRRGKERQGKYRLSLVCCTWQPKLKIGIPWCWRKPAIALRLCMRAQPTYRYQAIL